MPRRSTPAASTAVCVLGKVKQRNNVPRRKPRQRRRLRRQRLSMPRQAGVTAGYIATLNNPFEHGAVRLGWGTLVPSGLGTMFIRTTIVANTDGSLALGLRPYLNINNLGASGPLLYNNNGTTSTAWGNVNYTNYGAYGGVIGEARIVSLGLKAYPQIPATSAPAMVYAGSITSETTNDFFGRSPSNLVSSPTLSPSFGYHGAMSLGFPEDVDAFTFRAGTASADLGSVYPTAMPIITFIGLPASSPVIVEAVANFEFIYNPVVNTSATQDPLEGDQPAANMTSTFANIENMWNTVRRALSPAGTADNFENLARGSVNIMARLAQQRANQHRLQNEILVLEE